ncbi:Crp/Fnr family transcriptional regulator [Sphingomonas sp. CFBP8993]|uniref:Crp/Fnr family transcriptional regulator n=1 Tax=Sphingomonas sp. CFBP8993 TaxID=3096526 RepID=UPI002A6A0763|nr:Crp/Fnr family transcriptional regulator [Sphingomonas sp. CFBP8993]
MAKALFRSGNEVSVGNFGLGDRLDKWVSLTPAERDALSQLEDRPRAIRRGTVLTDEQMRSEDMYVVRQGMLMCYVLLDDGSRQILRFLFPGDLFALSALLYDRSPDTVVAVSNAVVCPFDRGQITMLATEHPRLLSLILVLNQIERVISTDRLAGLGRTSARTRVATLLLSLRGQMRQAGMDVGASFAPGLTQEEMGDAIGLTAVHVNRMLRQLEDEGLIKREGGRVHLLNEAQLVGEARYIDRFEGLDLSWLPPGR